MKQVITTTVLLIGAALLGVLSFVHYHTEEYARYTSPDQRYQIVVYRQPMLFAMPGQGGDAPGHVVLIGPNGRALKRQPIEMVQLATPPHWGAQRVSMKLQFDWELPPIVPK